MQRLRNRDDSLLGGQYMMYTAQLTGHHELEFDHEFDYEFDYEFVNEFEDDDDDDELEEGKLREHIGVGSICTCVLYGLAFACVYVTLVIGVNYTIRSLVRLLG